MKRVLLLGTLVVLLAVAMPLGHAQVPGAPSPGRTQLNLFLLDPGRGMPPGGVDQIELSVTYQFPQGAAPQPNPSPEVAENTSSTTITLSAKQLPSWVESAEFVPATLEARVPFDKQATGGSVAMWANVSLRIKPDAPALTREDIIVKADAEPNGNLAAATGESAPLKIRVEPVGKLNVTSDPSAVIAGGRWTTIVYQVKNEGNSDIVAKLNVTVQPENSEVEFPRTITLAPGATMPVEVRVRTPWTNAELGTLTLEAVPLLEGEEGRTASFDVDVRGESAVPSLALAPLVVVVALLALARRR